DIVSLVPPIYLLPVEIFMLSETCYFSEYYDVLCFSSLLFGEKKIKKMYPENVTGIGYEDISHGALYE
ncbi:hypothetical protein, partial [Salmonella sp. s54836]|uniref:hypothetical protein n=1 Tax=Salmonella sp. s54836 TaxID=3159673 RepID=UPI00397EC00F